MSAAMCATCPEVPGSSACDDCANDPRRPREARPADEVRAGSVAVSAAGAVYAWTEPAFHAWSSVLPLLLLPPVGHVFFPHAGEHSHAWLVGFAIVWLFCWVLAVPYTCNVAYGDGRVEKVRCGTRGQALRLAAAVRRKVGAPG